MKLNESQAKIVGKALQTLFISRNQVLGGENTVIWINLLSEKLSYEQILEACKYFCYNGDNFMSIPVIMSYFEKSPDKQAELQWAYLNAGKNYDHNAADILKHLIGAGNSLDKMSAYDRGDVKKQFIAIYSEFAARIQKEIENKQISDDTKRISQ